MCLILSIVYIPFYFIILLSLCICVILSFIFSFYCPCVLVQRGARFKWCRLKWLANCWVGTISWLFFFLIILNIIFVVLILLIYCLLITTNKLFFFLSNCYIIYIQIMFLYIFHVITNPRRKLHFDYWRRRLDIKTKPTLIT